MNIDQIPAGKNPPEDINVIVEVPVGGEPIKYEMDKASGALFVDRFLYTPMRYPGNYGFVPHTLSDDGDAIDVLIASTRALVPGAVINCRPIGVLIMIDEAGEDEKVIAVPSAKLTRRYEKIVDVSDLPEITLQQIQHFFEHYKDLEADKWVKLERWGNAAEAKQLINKALDRHAAKKMIRLVAMAALIAITACGPVPGGKLQGERQPVPDNWTDVMAEKTICEIESRPADPHSIQLECFLFNGQLHVQSHRYVDAGWWPAQSWAKIWQSDPQVTVRIGDALFSLNAVVVTEYRDQVLQLRGYDPVPEGIVVFRFDPSGQ